MTSEDDLLHKNNKTSIVLSIIIIVGLFGNILNLIIFFHKSMRSNSTFRYLLYLSLIDLLVVSFATSDALLTYGYLVIIRLNSNFFCRFHTFITYFLTQMSSLVLMVVSIDRKKNTLSLISISKLKLNTNCKLKLGKVEKTILFIAFILFLVNLHYLIFLNLNLVDENDFLLAKNETQNFAEKEILSNITKLNTDGSIIKTFNTTGYKKINQNNNSIFLMCFPKHSTIYSYFLTHVWIWIDTFIYSVMPFLVMLICSIQIIVEIKSKSKSFIKRKTLVAIKSRRRNNHLLVMLTVTNIYFILCSLPLCISMVYYKFKGPQSDTHSFQTFFHILAYSNNSMNFIFFGLFSKKYRQVFLNMFRKNPKKINKSEARESMLTSQYTNRRRRDAIISEIEQQSNRNNNLNLLRLSSFPTENILSITSFNVSDFKQSNKIKKTVSLVS